MDNFVPSDNIVFEDFEDPFDSDSIIVLNTNENSDSLDEMESSILTMLTLPHKDITADQLDEIEKLLEKEYENLNLIRSANESMRNMVLTAQSMSTSSTLTQNFCQVTATTDEKTNPIVHDEDETSNGTSDNVGIGSPLQTVNSEILGQVNDAEAIKNDECEMLTTQPNNVKTETIKDSQTKSGLRRPVLTPLRRRKPFQKAQGTLKGFTAATFQNFYSSLDTVSRYIIVACLVGFCSAFLLLSWYSSQTHHHDMEMFQLKEKHVQSQQQLYAHSQKQSHSFRETLIHQRYEETRECQSTLKTCHVKRDEMQHKIAQHQREKAEIKIKLELELEQERQKVKMLRDKLAEVHKNNKELKLEVAQSFSSAFTQTAIGLLNILKNSTTQLLVGGFIVVSSLMLFGCAALGKKENKSHWIS